MARALTILFVLSVAVLFWKAVPVYRLFDAFQPIVVALSVIVAAVFVRLNRGMPTLEWKNLEATKRKSLTDKIVDLSYEYVAILAISAFVLSGLITLIVIAKEQILFFPVSIQKIISGSVGALIALCFTRMAYIVWRDCDIIKLQKVLIDGSAQIENQELEYKSADKKIADMKAAGLQKNLSKNVTEL